MADKARSNQRPIRRTGSSDYLLGRTPGGVLRRRPLATLAATTATGRTAAGRAAAGPSDSDSDSDSDDAKMGVRDTHPAPSGRPAARPLACPLARPLARLLAPPTPSPSWESRHRVAMLAAATAAARTAAGRAPVGLSGADEGSFHHSRNSGTQMMVDFMSYSLANGGEYIPRGPLPSPSSSSS